MSWVRPFRPVAANRQLLLLELVGAASVARYALTILVGIYADRVAGAGAVGLAVLVRLAPAAVASPFVSARVERSSKRTMLLISLLVRAATILAMAATVSARGSLAALLALGAVYSVADSVQDPAVASLFPVHARTPTELAVANTLWTTLDNGTFLVGSLLVGGLVAWLSLTAAVAGCLLPVGAALVAAAALGHDVPFGSLPGAGTVDELLDGARAIAHEPDLRLLSSLETATMLAEGACDVLIVIAAVGLFALGPQGAGWLSAAWAIGAVGGGLIFVTAAGRGRLLTALTAGLLLGGLPLVLSAVAPAAPVPLLAFLALGVGFGMIEAVVLTLTQRLVPTDTLARVHGAYQTFEIGALALAAVAAGALVSQLGIRAALIITGIVLPAVAIALHRRLAALAPALTPDTRIYQSLRELDIFAVLPVATVETLAIRADCVELSAGTRIITQGEEGDSLHVIAVGSIDVEHDGRPIRTQHAGSYFGEIALLQNSTRTATVCARSPVTLLTITADRFLAATEPYPRSRTVAQATARTRLATTTPE